MAEFWPQYTEMLSVAEAEKPARAAGARVRMLAMDARVDKTGAILDDKGELSFKLPEL